MTGFPIHSSEREILWDRQDWWAVSAGQAGPCPHHMGADRVLQGLDLNHLQISPNRQTGRVET